VLHFFGFTLLAFLTLFIYSMANKKAARAGYPNHSNKMIRLRAFSANGVIVSLVGICIFLMQSGWGIYLIPIIIYLSLLLSIGIKETFPRTRSFLQMMRADKASAGWGPGVIRYLYKKMGNKDKLEMLAIIGFTAIAITLAATFLHRVTLANLSQLDSENPFGHMWALIGVMVSVLTTMHTMLAMHLIEKK
jgi:hypothetical protein